MRLRFALLPPWVRFLIWGSVFAGYWFAFTCFASASVPESVWRTAIFSLFFGIALGAYFVYAGRAAHKAVTEVADGLDKPVRSQAIGAITHGVFPSDPTVRSAAMRLGRAYLGGRSANELKRHERQTWIAMTVLVATVIAMAVVNSGGHHGLYFVALALFLVVATSLGVIRTRRIQRNVALLAEGPVPR